MPTKRFRTSYPYATATTVLVAIMGLASRELRKEIPPAPENALAASNEDYLFAGSRQTLRWRPFDEAVFQEAKKKNKMIMLVIGDICSRSARRADSDCFSDPYLADKVEYNVIPVRIDISQRPDMATAFLPFLRSEIGLLPYFQLNFLTPNGDYLNSSYVLSPTERMTDKWLLGRIEGARSAWIKMGNDRRKTLQVEDHTLLDGPVAEPDLASRYRLVAAATGLPQGGMVIKSFAKDELIAMRQQIDPQSLDFLWRMGDVTRLARTVDSILLSPLNDLLDGGFFMNGSDAQFGGIMFDKFAVPNAEMALILARLYAKTKRPAYRYFCERTVSFLLNEMAELGPMRAYRIGDENDGLRSRRTSIPAYFLRSNFSPEDREWLRVEFNLRSESNPQMIPRLRSLDLAGTEKMTTMLERIRTEKRFVSVKYGGEGILDVEGTVAARLLQVARVLDDTDLMAKIAVRTDDLSLYRVGVGVAASKKFQQSQPASLGDYLGFADAMLQDYMVFGRINSLERGATVLETALSEFAGEREGEFNEGSTSDIPFPIPYLPSPRLTDERGESSIARLMRLTYVYGTVGQFILQETKPESMLAAAQSIRKRYSKVANRMPNLVSGFFASSSFMQYGVVVAAVGRRPEKLFRNTAIALPWIPVVPIYGVEQGSDQAEGSLYILRNGILEGPTPMEEIIRKFPSPIQQIGS